MIPSHKLKECLLQTIVVDGSRHDFTPHPHLVKLKGSDLSLSMWVRSSSSRRRRKRLASSTLLTRLRDHSSTAKIDLQKR